MEVIYFNIKYWATACFSLIVLFWMGSQEKPELFWKVEKESLTNTNKSSCEGLRPRKRIWISPDLSFSAEEEGKILGQSKSLHFSILKAQHATSVLPDSTYSVKVLDKQDTIVLYVRFLDRSSTSAELWLVEGTAGLEEENGENVAVGKSWFRTIWPQPELNPSCQVAAGRNYSWTTY